LKGTKQKKNHVQANINSTARGTEHGRLAELCCSCWAYVLTISFACSSAWLRLAAEYNTLLKGGHRQYEPPATTPSSLVW